MVICGIAALVLSAILVPGLKAANPGNSDILVQVLGGTTDLVAEQAYREADVYFHSGLDDEKLDAELKYYHPKVRLPLIGMIRRLHGETAPKVERIVQASDEKELLPWFVIAIRLNPHHIEAWRVGSYWYYRTGDSRRAEELLRDAIRQNPNDYRLYLDRGILYHRLKNWDGAVNDLETAQKLWKNNSEDAPYDLKAIRIYLNDSRKNSQ